MMSSRQQMDFLTANIYVMLYSTDVGTRFVLNVFRMILNKMKEYAQIVLSDILCKVTGAFQ